MKSLKRSRILSLIAGTGLLLTCCQASAAGYKLADKVGASIAEFRDEIVDVKKEVDATLASLDKIVAQATVDPRKAFKEFDKNVPRVESAATKAKELIAKNKSEGLAVQQNLDKVIAELNTVVATITPSKAKK